jgi:phosphoribosylamine---glycine ligase
MRFLGIGDAADLGSLYLALLKEGHEVKVHINNPLCADTLTGLVPHTDDWRTELDWIRAAKRDGCILFENVSGGRGAQQDILRRQGFNVIGSSAYGARLETERKYAQTVLTDLGLQTAPATEFASVEEALAFIQRRPKRYALKFNCPDGATHIGRLMDGSDIAAVLKNSSNPLCSDFMLMDYVEGIEMGVGAFFNGERFLLPACLDWEHKRFFPGDLGELTGEMGTVVTYSRTSCFFGKTLAKMEPLLRENGYCGYINLNTIVNDHGIWPLEFTCRFGYPGFAILASLQRTAWGALFASILRKDIVTFNVKRGFAVGIVITTPPFPYSREHVHHEPIGMPVQLSDVKQSEREHIHYGEVGLKNGQLVTTGASGYTMVVTGTGDTIIEALSAANALASKIIVQNARYRTDIGMKLIDGNLARLEILQLFDPA